MRICYVCADSGVSLGKHNGSAAHVRAIVDAFGELGHEVEVLLADVEGSETLGVPVRAIPRPAFARALCSIGRGMSDDADREPAMTASLRALRRLWIDPGLERALKGTLRRFRPHVVYERLSPFSVAGPVVAARAGFRHVLEVNAPLAWEGAWHRGQALGLEADLLERMAFAATSCIVTVSDMLRDRLAAVGVDPEKIRVVPNGVDVRRFADARPPSSFDPAGKLVAGFVGSLKPWHGVERLLETFETLWEEMPRLHLLVVGDGPLAARVEALRARHPGRVTWTGAVPQSDVPSWLAATQIAVAPYPQQDDFYFSPLKVLEYMAAGNAIVASRIGQIEQLLRNGETALLVDPGHGPALADAIRHLGADPDLARKLGERARADARREHTWLARADEILTLVRSAAA